MKTLLAFLAILFSLSALAQFPPSVVRNFWSTNANAREVISAGTNAFVTFSTSGTDTRTYRIDIPYQTWLTNGLTGIGVTSGSNSVTTTNGNLVTVYSLTDTNVVRLLASAVATTNSVYASNVLSGGQVPFGTLATNPIASGFYQVTPDGLARNTTLDLGAGTNITAASIVGIMTNNTTGNATTATGLAGGKTNQVYAYGSAAGWSGYSQLTNQTVLGVQTNVGALYGAGQTNSGNVQVGGLNTSGSITASAYNTTYYQLLCGALGIQSYGLNNGFLAENCVYNGGWKYKNTGYASLFYFFTGEGQFRCFASGTGGNALPSAGDTPTAGAGTQLKVNADGTVAMGYPLSGVGSPAVAGVYSDFAFVVQPTKVTIRTNTYGTSVAATVMTNGFASFASNRVSLSSLSTSGWTNLDMLHNQNVLFQSALSGSFNLYPDGSAVTIGTAFSWTFQPGQGYTNGASLSAVKAGPW